MDRYYYLARDTQTKEAAWLQVTSLPIPYIESMIYIRNKHAAFTMEEITKPEFETYVAFGSLEVR